MSLFDLPDVQRTMLDQLGGPGMLLMTGARDLVFSVSGRSLRFKLPASMTRHRGNYFEIVLQGNDLYRIEYGIVTLRKHKVIAVNANVGAEELRPIFEAITGLVCKL